MPCSQRLFLPLLVFLKGGGGEEVHVRSQAAGADERKKGKGEIDLERAQTARKVRFSILHNSFFLHRPLTKEVCMCHRTG